MDHQRDGADLMSAPTQMALAARPLIGTPASLGSAANGAVGAGVGSVSMTTTANIVAGDLVVVGVAFGTNSSSLAASMSDGTNTYTKADTTGLFSASELSLWYCANAAAVASGASITCTLSVATSGTGNAVAMEAARVTSLGGVPLDKVAHNSNIASPTSVTATTAALTLAPELSIGVAVALGSASYSGASGFTNLINVSDGVSSRIALDYQQTSSTAAVAYAPTYNASSRMGGVVATFKGL